MYYIKQVEGKLVDAAKQIKAAVDDGDLEKARKIWCSVTDKPPVDRELWWKYSACHQIVCQSGLTEGDWYSLRFYVDESEKAQAAAELAERRNGGKWVAEYTY